MNFEKTAFAALTEEQRGDVRGRIAERLRECERARVDVQHVTCEIMIAFDEGGYVVAHAVEPPAPALLTPEGERIVAAISARDFTGITESQYRDLEILALKLAAFTKAVEKIDRRNAASSEAAA